MYLSILILPLLGSIVSGFFGRRVGVTGAHIISSSSIIITTILAIIIFFEVGLNNISLFINLFRWIDSEWFNIIWGFQFDSLTVSMLIPVLIISSLVHIYSIGYMSTDPHNQRFFSYLSLFTFMMIILVTGNNYLLMFVGWEGVGVCSYLLISFWFTRIAANQSSMSAFLTNRVGDCFLTIGMFAILWSIGNLDYSTVFSLAPYLNENTIIIIGICLLIGAMAKSSQVGLHVWLPMAMEGPTPVSALIHAATMVTAGVYLLMRSSPLIEYSSTILLLCLWLGAITTVFSSLVGFFQQDIKKVIAYSTMSQLGMMVIAVGLSSYNLALFHLINHAFYKGLLFLGAGAVIHAMADNQDFRKYGGLISFLPLSYSVILIASLSLVAFPFMTGFYSKDFILESAYGQYCFSSITVYIIATIGAIFTTLYSVKVLYLTFLSPASGPLASYHKAHESDIFMSLPLIILAVFSIFFGFLTKDIFIGLGSGFFIDNSIFIHPEHEITIDTEFGVSTFWKLLPFVFTVSFSIIALTLSEFLSESILNFKLTRLGYTIFGFFNQRFLVEFFYNKYITNAVLNLGGQSVKVLDKGAIELLGPWGLEKSLVNSSKNLNKLSSGVVTNYALYILIGFISYLFFITLLPYQDINLLMRLSVLVLICSAGILVQTNYTNTSHSDATRKLTNKLNTGLNITSLHVSKTSDIQTPSLYKGVQVRKFSSSASPIITYSNAKEVKSSIYADNKGRSGIYLWTNKLNDKKYVGSSQDLKQRFKDYFDNYYLNNSKGSIICKALLKNGHENFSLSILEYCNIEDLITREQYYLDTLKPDYNILSFARSSKGYLHTDESKTLMSLIRNEWEFTPEHLNSFSVESVRNKPTTVTNISTGEITTYSSMGEVAKFLDVSVTTIREILNSNDPYKGYLLSQTEDSKFSSKAQSVKLIHIKDSSIIKEFPTVQKAAEFLNVDRSTLNNIINNPKKNNTGIVDEYYISKLDKHIEYVRSNSKAIEVTDLELNSTIVYSSITEAANALGINKGSISMYLKGNSTSPYKKRYIIKRI
uniref:NADH-ubiquinone oxidoreductase chain 5 n=1 Tax=Ophiostoma novo-ulmi subsp. novo-ulmi TaxID=170179 RepID=A0A2L1IPT6_OPHNO|nr:NADH dehydrogenase subunit 5 [Ophiostoma novo-ulmi subsp. novo-ulmi]